MANSIRNNIIFIDTAGQALGLTIERRIIGINVIPTGATHTILLKDGDGNTFFEHNNNAPAPVLTKPIPVTGIVATTLTTARVILWIED